MAAMSILLQFFFWIFNKHVDIKAKTSIFNGDV
jgi:hypothetical protein